MGAGTGAPPSLPLGLTSNYGVSLGISSAAGMPYDYISSMNASSASSTIPLQSSYAPIGSHLGGGMGYGSGHGFGYSAVDGPYGMNLATTRTQMMAAGRPGFMTEESGARKRRGDAKSEGDWICPKCGNTNYSFRVVCNMKKCNTPKPAAPVSQIHGIPSSADTTPPDGSWTCDQCGNVNYPFRTKCNRRSCGAEKPSNKREPSGSPSTSE
ncbi:hypothetical protein KP509_11G096600 [Ceratopteris richardii]|nr:hypothetical protein KP509_11G096600 [Ceratopteris richardii]